MAIKSQFPALKPTADFNFAATKTLDPRITFSRASPATYYDGKTLAKAEENLWIGSTSVPSQAEATKTDNAATTPSGYAACLVVPNTTTGNHTGGYLNNYVLAGLDYVFSFVTKAAGYSKIRTGNAATATVAATFDLVALTVSGTIGGAYVSSGIDDLGDGWRRCWVKANHSTSQLVALSITPFPDGATVDNYGRASFTGDGVSGAYFGEFQVEQRSAFSFHTPTTTSAITNWQPALLTAPAGAPRFQHDPVSGKSLGFLPERQSTNLMTWSEFGGASITTGITTSGGDFSASKMFGPDGNLVNAVRFPGPPSANSYLYKGIVPAETTCTVSAYVRMDDGGAPVVGSNALSGDFNIVIGALVTTPATVEHIGGSLYRVSATRTTGALNLGNNGIIKYATQSSRGFRTTGWQLEQHSKATSYIKTEGTTVNRAADSAVIDGANLDSFYNQRGGTFLVDAMLSSAATAAVLNLSYGTANSDRLNIYVTQGSSALSTDNLVNSGASGSVSAAGAVSTQPSRRVIARRAADYSHAVCVNGGPVTASTSGKLGLRNRLEIGATAGGALQLDSPIARLAYYDELLTEAQMQALTKV